MNAEELSKALKDNNAELAKTFTTILVEAGVIKKADDKPDDTKVSKEDKPKAKEAPVFKGELSDKAAVLAHKKALAIWKAEIEFADDPVALFERMEKIEEEFSSSKDLAKVDAEAGVEPGDSPEVRRLKRELAKEQRKSNQDTGDPTPDYSDGTTNLSKEDEDAVRAGVRAAKIARGENPDK